MNKDINSVHAQIGIVGIHRNKITSDMYLGILIKYLYHRTED